MTYRNEFREWLRANWEGVAVAVVALLIVVLFVAPLVRG